MSSGAPESTAKDAKPATSEKQAEPAPSEPVPQKPAAEAEKPSEDAWEEAYEELIGPEEPPRSRRPKRHWGAVVAVAVILILILVWTLLSPEIMTEVGETYVESPEYSSWGSYTGYRDIWAGNMTWGLSINGTATAAGNRSIEVSVLITKVSEKLGNWFLRGTAIELRNVSVFDIDGTFLGEMSNWTDVGFGVMAKVPITFPAPGTYDMYVCARFVVYEVMQIGFLPLEAQKIDEAEFDFPIEVT